MKPALGRLLDPLNLVGTATVLVVAYTTRWLDEPAHTYALAGVLGFLILSVLVDLQPVGTRHSRPVMAAQAVLLVLALVVIFFGARTGVAHILLVIWVAHIAFRWPPRMLFIAMALANLASYAMLLQQGIKNPLLVTFMWLCFQAFAALLATYTRRIEEARDHLAVVNADLLATRALLAETTRSNERYRVARDLHDVAGHKLTAMRLNLRALANAHPEDTALRESEVLSAELLNDIRGVVHALRADECLDIEPALAALAAPFPRPKLQLTVAPDVRITHARVAEAVVRCVQEALTNAAKHGVAATLRVTLTMQSGALVLMIEDDGVVAANWKAGNGLMGMRERVEEAGGILEMDARAGHGMQIEARFKA